MESGQKTDLLLRGKQMDTFLAFFCFLMRISRLYSDHHWSAVQRHLVVGRFLRNGTV